MESQAKNAREAHYFKLCLVYLSPQFLTILFDRNMLYSFSFQFPPSKRSNRTRRLADRLLNLSPEMMQYVLVRPSPSLLRGCASSFGPRRAEKCALLRPPLVPTFCHQTGHRQLRRVGDRAIGYLGTLPWDQSWKNDENIFFCLEIYKNHLKIFKN